MVFMFQVISSDSDKEEESLPESEFQLGKNEDVKEVQPNESFEPQ